MLVDVYIQAIVSEQEIMNNIFSLILIFSTDYLDNIIRGNNLRIVYSQKYER